MRTNPYYCYSAITERPELRWPNDARIAFWVVPNVEHFWFERPTSVPSPEPVPDVPNIAKRDYGSRVGIWRLIEVLDRYEIRATVALNAEAANNYPEIVRAGIDRNWEWMAHGLSNSQRLNTLDPRQERDVIASATSIITEATGQRPMGWLGPGLVESPHTIELLNTAGYVYVADWCADDQPFALSAAGHSLYSMPYSIEVNDYTAFVTLGYTPEQFYRVVMDQFEVLYQESSARRCVMTLPLHPYLSGHPFRIKWLQMALDHIVAHDGVWVATGAEIVQAFVDSERRRAASDAIDA